MSIFCCVLMHVFFCYRMRLIIIMKEVYRMRLIIIMKEGWSSTLRQLHPHLTEKKVVAKCQLMQAICAQWEMSSFCQPWVSLFRFLVHKCTPLAATLEWPPFPEMVINIGSQIYSELVLRLYQYFPMIFH